MKAYLWSLLKPQTLSKPTKPLLLPPHHHHQSRGIITKVRLKWVKNRTLDHVIDNETDLKAASLLKDAIKRSPTGFLTSKSFADWQKLLGLTVPVLRFMRRYPTLFQEFPHARYPSLPCFKLTDTALFLDSQERNIYETHEADIVERLSRVLMMMKTKSLPLQSLYPLKWDLGLPDGFERVLVAKYPDSFRFVKASDGVTRLKVVRCPEEYAISALQRSKEGGDVGDEYRQFKRGQTTLAFPMSFPRGYGAQKKVRAWMEEFQKLPYISPYEDSRQIDPSSDLIEKRVVGVLHEFLSLTIHKKTKRNYLRIIREEFNLPQKFTRIFTRYPGIFYLSLKCKTTTVALREGYQRGKLVNPHPLARLREKFYHVMRTGLIYRNKGVDMLSPQDMMLDNVGTESGQDECEEEEGGIGDEYEDDEVSEWDSEECDED